MNQPRTVTCIKLKEELPALPFKPFPTEFGQMIYDRVSMQAWRMWLQESPRYINTYRIDLQSAEGRDFLEKQMRVFFGFEDGELAETAWTSPSRQEPPPSLRASRTPSAAPSKPSARSATWAVGGRRSRDPRRDAPRTLRPGVVATAVPTA